MRFKQHIFVGRTADIPIFLHLSWPLFLILGVGALALGPVEIIYAGWPPILRWAFALGLGLLMALSVILHDAAHLAVAAARRLPVRRIDLYPFGGLMQLRGVPVPAVPLIQMTLAGPAAGLLLAAFWLGAGWFLDLTPLYWVAQFNLALTLANLLPAPPLDGGRLLWLVRGYFPGTNNGAIVAFSALAFLGLATVLPGGMAVLSGVIQLDPAYIFGGALFILTGVLIQKTPGQRAIVCNKIQQTWLKQTTVGQFLEEPERFNPGKAGQFRRIRCGPSFFSADTTGPCGPATLLLTPTMAAWVIHPDDSLLTALFKLYSAQTNNLLVVTGGTVIDSLTYDQILISLQKQKTTQQMTKNALVLLQATI